jgi:hypothetical protein
MSLVRIGLFTSAEIGDNRGMMPSFLTPEKLASLSPQAQEIILPLVAYYEEGSGWCSSSCAHTSFMHGEVDVGTLAFEGD